MSKTQTYATFVAGLQNIVETNKVSNAVKQALFALADEVLKPKVNKAETREIDGVVYYPCRYTGRFFPQDEMVFANGKSKGYSKVGYKAWLANYNAIKKTKAQLADAIIEGDKAQEEELRNSLEELQAKLNAQSTYADLEGGVE